jgi:predicted nucleotidyltransferase
LLNTSKEVPDPGKPLCVNRRGDRVGCSVENKKSTGLSLEVPEIEKFVNISKEVLGEDNILEILLFGSQSMKTDDEWSDYDFYVVTRKKFGWNEKFEIYEKIDFPSDIVFRTRPEVNEGINMLCPLDIYAITFGRIIYGEDLEEEKKKVTELLENKIVILRPELGKGVIEYGAKA